MLNIIPLYSVHKKSVEVVGMSVLDFLPEVSNTLSIILYKSCPFKFLLSELIFGIYLSVYCFAVSRLLA